MGGVCGIGSIKGRLSPIESLSGTLSIPVGGILDCDIYDGEYTVTPSDTVQILPNRMPRTMSTGWLLLTMKLRLFALRSLALHLPNLFKGGGCNSSPPFLKGA